MGRDCLTYKSYWLRDHFLLVVRSDHITRSRNIKPEVVFKVQKMARYASFCVIMDPFKGEVPVFARLWPVRVRVSFTTGASRSIILATAGLLVYVGRTSSVMFHILPVLSLRLDLVNLPYVGRDGQVELAWVTGYTPAPRHCTHPSTNRVRRRVTSLKRRTTLLLRQTASQGSVVIVAVNLC